MESVEIRQIGKSTQYLGEGPHWEPGNQSLLFVDILACDLHRYTPATERHQILHIVNANLSIDVVEDLPLPFVLQIAEDCGTGRAISFAVPVEDDPNLLVVGLGRSLAIVEWSPNDPDEKTVKPKAVLHTVDEQTPTNRFNDGKCDPSGRLWAGTMGQWSSPGQRDLHKGTLFSLDSKLSLSTHVDKVSLSNGLAWSHDKKTFYYIDSLDYSVDAFDYDHYTGDIGNRRKVLNYKTSNLPNDIPDGMCIDENGNLWVANFLGKKIICIDPKAGKILRTIETPTQNMTSVCWGGENYDTLFATSAAMELSSEQIATQPAGATFAITGLGVKGLPPVNFKTDLQVLKTKFTG